MEKDREREEESHRRPNIRRQQKKAGPLSYIHYPFYDWDQATLAENSHKIVRIMAYESIHLPITFVGWNAKGGKMSEALQKMHYLGGNPPKTRVRERIKRLAMPVHQQQSSYDRVHYNLVVQGR
jgi:hypothetical protein